MHLYFCVKTDCVLSSPTVYLISVAQKMLSKHELSSSAPAQACLSAALSSNVPRDVASQSGFISEKCSVRFEQATLPWLIFDIHWKKKTEKKCDVTAARRNPLPSLPPSPPLSQGQLSSAGPQLSACFSDGMVQITQDSVKKARRYRELLVLT